MGKVLPEISDKEAAFIASQKVFFVATAPLSADHHVSVSPKANTNHGSTLVVLDPHTVAYADFTGSGAETAAHVMQNGRMTIMFCNIEAGLPKILRLLGTAQVILADAAPQSLLDQFANEIIDNPGFRAIYKLNVHRISASCGFSLPVMTFERYRQTLDEYSIREGKEGMFNYSTLKNSYSIDGLPSLALWRKHAPVGIEAVFEEGYFFGRVPQGNNVLAPFRQWTTRQKMWLNKRGRSIVVGLVMVAIAATMFWVGVQVGKGLAEGGASSSIGNVESTATAVLSNHVNSEL